MHAIVHAADIQDRDGGAFVMATMFGMYPFLMKLYADGGYQGPLFRRAVAKILAQVNVEIFKLSDQAKGFVVLPKRWVVERTFAWLGRCRRLVKDWETLNRKALASAPRLYPPHAAKTMQSRMVPSRVVLEFADASSGDVRLSDHAARSMIWSDGFSAR